MFRPGVLVATVTVPPPGPPAVAVRMVRIRTPPYDSRYETRARPTLSRPAMKVYSDILYIAQSFSAAALDPARASLMSPTRCWKSGPKEAS